MRKMMFLVFLSVLGLKSNAQVVIGEINDYIICEYNFDGFAIFNLHYKTDEILEGLNPNDYVVSYHYSSSDAQNGINAIPPSHLDDYQNMTNPEALFVRLEKISDGAYDTTSFDLIVASIPDSVTPEPIVVEDLNENGFAEFDLTVRESEIINGEDNIVLSYFEIYLDAVNNESPIANPQVYHNLIPFYQIVYVRSENDISGCYEVIELELIVGSLSNDDFDISSIVFYPNPVIETLTLKNLPAGEIVPVTLYDLNGKICVFKNINTSQNTIHLGNFPKGMYFLQINIQDKSVIRKVIRK